MYGTKFQPAKKSSSGEKGNFPQPDDPFASSTTHHKVDPTSSTRKKKQRTARVAEEPKCSTGSDHWRCSSLRTTRG